MTRKKIVKRLKKWEEVEVFLAGKIKEKLHPGAKENIWIKSICPEAISSRFPSGFVFYAVGGDSRTMPKHADLGELLC